MENTSPAMPFRSFFMGGFECATKRYKDGRRIDIIAQSRHDERCEQDYRMLAELGIRTVRDGLRWHLIEKERGRYDWSNWLPMLEASKKAGVQVLWDIVHWGAPDHADMWSADFPQHYADFAVAAAELFKREIGDAPVWCPINEISYWAYRATQEVWPHTEGSGDRVKEQLVRASCAAIPRLREVDSRTQIMAVDPLVYVLGPNGRDIDAEGWIFQTWDMLMGRTRPELGGNGDMVDIIGVNFYGQNEWRQQGPDFRVSVGEWTYMPLHKLLGYVHQRYNKPVVISETGAEGDNGPGWMRYIAGEARMAQQAGTPLWGLCTYPIMDYPGWLDGRHCPCGVIRLSDDWNERSFHMDMVDAVREQQFMLENIGALKSYKPAA